MVSLGELGALLRGAGLTPRALAAWAGTDRISQVTTLVEELAAKEPLPAAIALSLFVAGRDVAIESARGLGSIIDPLVEHDLVEVHDHTLRATMAILPVGRALVVCDRANAAPTTERVCWPDDSSYHLASAIPAGRVESWIDLGCGSAFAPLVRPELAAAITGVELNPEAARMARLGAELSGIAHLTIETADLAVELPAAPLVTCNAPMPGGGGEMWRHTDDGFFERLWRVLPDRVAPGGTAVVHAAVSAIPYERLGGDRTLVVYTPPEVAPAFCVLWWRPDAADRLTLAARELTAERPHLDARDRDA
jgi:hypothetical protein